MDYKYKYKIPSFIDVNSKYYDHIYNIYNFIIDHNNSNEDRFTYPSDKIKVLTSLYFLYSEYAKKYKTTLFPDTMFTYKKMPMTARQVFLLIEYADYSIVPVNNYSIADDLKHILTDMLNSILRVDPYIILERSIKIGTPYDKIVNKDGFHKPIPYHMFWR